MPNGAETPEEERMMKVNQVVDKLMSSGIGGGLAGGLASGLLVSSLGSKKGRKLAGKAAKLGGAALVGGLAWKAYDNYRSRQNQPTGIETTGSLNRPPAAHSRAFAGTTSAPSATDYSQWSNIRHEEFEPLSSEKVDQRDLLILRSMIAAAHADGHMDSTEKARIFEQLESLETDSMQKALLIDEFLQPLTLTRLVAQVPNAALAAEAYLASLITVDINSSTSVDYLNQLSEALSIPDELRKALHEEAFGPEDLRSHRIGHNSNRNPEDIARSA